MMKKKSRSQYDIMSIMKNSECDKNKQVDNNTINNSIKQKSVSHNDIISYLSHFKNVDDLLEYNCPSHLELSFNDSARHSNEKATIPEYKEPSQIYVSTMTTVCYLTLKYSLNLSALFNMLPCYAPELCFPNKEEIKILNLVVPTTGKRTRKKKIPIKHDDKNRLKQFTEAYMSSGWILKYNNAYCPLQTYYKHYCQYFEERSKIAGVAAENIKQLSYEEWRNQINDVLDTLKEENSDFNNIYIKKVYRNIYYPPQQRMYSSALITKTEFYNPQLCQNGTEFIFGCDVRNVFPTIIDNRYKGMIKGDPTVSAKKKASLKAFDNQCTMRIAGDTLESKINTKMFVNGKLQMTGCKSIEGTKKAVRYIVHELEILSYYMEMYNKVMRELKVKNINISETPEEVSLNDIPNEIMEKVMNNMSAMDLLNFMTVSKSFFSVVNNDQYWINRIKDEFKFKIRTEPDGKSYAYEKYNPRYREYKKLTELKLIENPIKFYVACSDERYVKPYTPLRPQIIKEPIEISEIRTEMINSNFDAHFFIDQTRLTKILQSDPYNMFVTFDTHPGVNIKYNIKDEEGKDNEITILVFRTGNVIITGVKSYDLLHKSYNFINSILKKHYYEIWQVSDNPNNELVKKIMN